MSRPVFAIFVIAIIAIALLAMWLGWRARSRRDASVLASAAEPIGAVIAEFARVFYVSTTPAGEPLVRVAAPGLRYRGWARVAVREDGVTVSVTGEQPVHFAAEQVRGSGSAGRRVGTAVESDGLALMRWTTDDGRELESSFRFETSADQRRFMEAIDGIADQAGTEAIDEIAGREPRKTEEPGTLDQEQNETEEGQR